ncbi:MAG: DUF4159 domain-containing protein [bacterium]|nr:DUF4159 domain-containing protein [bacterium]
MPIKRLSNLLLILAGALALSALAVAQPADNRPAPAEPGRVEVAMLTYGSARITSVCFSDKFLELVRRQTSIRVHDEFAKADLATDSIFDYPLLIMTGEGAFELTDDEVTRLRSFLSRGGILLASAGCSNERWNESMRRTLERVLPASEPVELGMDHPMFTSLYQVSSLEGSRYKGAPQALRGIEINGRIAVVYSPSGLNDTQNAEAGCCCCGGSEIRNARYINANILVYALTR